MVTRLPSASTSNLQVRWLRLALMGAMLPGMLCCLSLWLNTREYPLVPVFSVVADFAAGVWPDSAGTHAGVAGRGESEAFRLFHSLNHYFEVG
jgi:hypothetical protein